MRRSYFCAGPNSYRSAGGETRCYLELGEAAELLEGWQLVHYAEYLGRAHRHGDDPLHRHGRLDVVAVRPRRDDDAPGSRRAG